MPARRVQGKGKEQPISASDDTRPSSSALLAAINATLEEGKAEDVIVIDLAGKTTMADYMIIATGTSKRQINALAGNLIRNIKRAGFGTPGVEGRVQSDWVLLDAGDVIVHLFRPQIRTFYNLEKMWMATAAEMAPGVESSLHF